MTANDYTINEHTHRFAVWTAARAASRSRLKNSEVEFLITASLLKEKVEALRQIRNLDEPYYRNWIRETGEIICQQVIDKNWSPFKTKTFHFGLAAKIISIYIKTVEVLPTKGEALLAQIAYPPIDGILLKNINKKHSTKFEVNWSTFSWQQYEKVIDKLQEHYSLIPGWKIEVEWSVSNEEAIEVPLSN